MKGYAKDPGLNLYRRPADAGIAYSDGDATEAAMLEAVRSVDDRSVLSRELVGKIVDWPSEYHFSRLRHCIVRPLDIRPGDRVLEIGCGCGAISRYLGEIGAEVTALEGSPQRARIAAERCRDLPNVRFVVGDFGQVELGERFDWVLFIGVIEYAPVFSDHPDAVRHYMDIASGYLEDDGRLVIAIENKLGLKYFAGCREDHLARQYYGIQGLYQEKEPVTFGKRELAAKLAEAGFKDSRFWYPFPDYKLPSLIVSEEAVGGPDFDVEELMARIYARDYGGYDARHFDETLVLKEAARNGLLGDLANSFLVVARRRADRSRPVDAGALLAATYAVHRRPEFTVETRLLRRDGGIVAEKRPLVPEASRQIECAGLTVDHVPGTEKYVRGELAVWSLTRARARGATFDEIVERFLPWFDYLTSRAERDAALAGSDFATLTLDGGCYDLTPFNLVKTATSFSPIDDEWRVRGRIPLGLVVTRAVYSCLHGLPGFEYRPVSIGEVILALAASRDLSVSAEELDGWLEVERQVVAAIHGRAFGEAAPVLSIESRRQFTGMEQKLESRIREQTSYIATLLQSLADQQAVIRDREGIIRDRESAIESRDAEVARWQQMAQRLHSSTSWRITSPLRMAGRFLRGDFGQIRRTPVKRYGEELLERKLAKLPGDSGQNTPALQAIIDARCAMTAVPVTIDPLSATLKTPPRIDISAVTYNNAQWLDQFIASLRALDYPKDLLAVTFVDNGSREEEFEAVQEAAEALRGGGYEVRVIRQKNRGFGCGHDVAIRSGNAPFCLVTNVDLVFEPSTLRRLAAVASVDDADVAAWEVRQRPFEHPKFYDPVTGFTNWNSHACVLLRRSAYEEVGGYDRRIFMYGEDVELSYRLRRHGYRLRYCPQAVVDHFTYGDDISVIKPLQYRGSVFANTYLRMRYGNREDATVGRLLFLQQMITSSAYPGVRLDLLKQVPKLIGASFSARPKAGAGASFPFRGWDYELQRPGAAFQSRHIPADAPLVSVITRTIGDRDPLLRQAMLSVAHQTYANIEHIIVQDGGDSAADVVREVAAATGRATRFIPLGKVGRSAAGNAGIDAAAGRWCVLLDDDDLLFADHVEVLVQTLLDNPAAVAAYSSAWEVATEYLNADRTAYREHGYRILPDLGTTFSKETLSKMNFLSIQSVLFSKELFEQRGGLDEDLETLEDWVLWNRYAEGNEFAFAPKVTSLFRVPASEESRTARQEALDSNYAEALARVESFSRDPLLAAG